MMTASHTMTETITNTQPAAAASAAALIGGTTSTISPPTSLVPPPKKPSRKSTLTQQQKNQKRQRATTDQLSTLEREFNKNPTPTAPVRERIADEINMTERSVQIWFQNKRAKIKLLAKKSIETGEDCDAIPESMRQYLAIQAAESGKTLGRNFLGKGDLASPYMAGSALFDGDSSNSGKVVIHHFSCRALSIGSWRRVGQNAMDLVIFYSPDKGSITYYINNDSAGYKIEYPFTIIKNITLDNGESATDDMAQGQRTGGIIVELTRPPQFFMDSSGSGGFYQCGDFTEGQQASSVMQHYLAGNPKVLSGQLAKLYALDTFSGRHGPTDYHQVAASAPVSPGLHRPASQPNHVTHPHVGMFQESQYGVNLHPQRGHKRQRSRSVPVAIDFSMLQSPSFTMQHFHPAQSPQSQPPPPTSSHSNHNPMNSPQIFAPVPQHQHQLSQPDHDDFGGALGPNLRIDTSPGFGLDYRSYPMSATTASPSEYASPSFFSGTAGPSESMTAPATTQNFQTPYSLPFLSPMADPAAINAHSVSPLSAVSPGDPVIADQSPPLSAMSGMHRSASADFFGSTHDPSNISDDGLSLTDLYSKQNLNMQVPSPGFDTSAEELAAMQSMVTFDPLDSDLSPEASGA